MGTPRGWSTRAFLRNSGSSTNRWNGGAYYRENENGDVRRGVNARFSTRPSPALQLSISPEYSTEVFSPSDLFSSLSAPGDNIFASKTTFWIAR